MSETAKQTLQQDFEDLKEQYEQLRQQIGHAEARAYGRLTELEAESDTLRKQMFALNKYLASAIVPVPPDSEAMREALAAYSHEAWSGWMRYMFDKGSFEQRPSTSGNLRATEVVYVMPAEYAELWQRQMNTPYAELPEGERASDRAEADKIVAVLARIAGGKSG